MPKDRRGDICGIVVFGGAFAILVDFAVAGILFRSPNVEMEQTVYPFGLNVSPNPLPGLGLDETGEVNFTFQLTVSDSIQNPNLSLTVYAQPSTAQNLTLQHCLENSQPNLSALKNECDKGKWHTGWGQCFANITSGISIVLRVLADFVGTNNEPVSVKWTFYATGVEIP